MAYSCFPSAPVVRCCVLFFAAATLSLGALSSSATTLELTPASHDFGDVLLGENADFTFTLTNPDSVPASVGGFSPLNAPFARLSGDPDDCLVGTELADGSSCAVRIRYSPSSTTTSNANLIVVANDFTPLQSALSGTGVSPALSIDPIGPIVFPQTETGFSAPPQVFTVSNSGSNGSVLTLDAPILDGDSAFSLQSGPGSCSASQQLVAGGGSCTVTVLFSPLTTGPASTQLIVSASAGAIALSPLLVDISGSGITPAAISVTLPPQGLTAVLEVGDNAALPLQIINSGEAPLDWLIGDALGALPALQDPSQSMEQTSFSAPVGSPRGTSRAQSTAIEVANPEVRGGGSGVPIGSGLVEGFDDISLLPARGWQLINRSQPLGSVSWFQGNAAEAFPAHSGPPNGYVAASFENTLGAGTISNWLITPELALINGTQLRFRTRTVAVSAFPDRLQVRLSAAGGSSNVGTSATDVGDFTTLLLDINANQQVGGYPTDWGDGQAGDIVITLSELPQAITGRIALRYFIVNGGPLGSASNYVGIDTLSVTQPGCTNPDQANLGWLNLSQSSGTTMLGNPSEVTVSLDATGLAPREYIALLCVESSDPFNPLLQLPVSLSVEQTVEPSIFRSGFEAPR